MALELLAGPFDVFPVVDRTRVTTGLPTTQPSPLEMGGDAVLIDGRGILTGSGDRQRFVVQHDGAYAQIGVARFQQVGMQPGYVLTCLGGRQSYAEYDRYGTGSPALSTGRLHELHPVTLMGWKDIGSPPPGAPQSAMLLPDGTWISAVAMLGAPAMARHSGGSGWVVDAELPISAGAYLSHADNPDEVWVANFLGECVRYDWRRRLVVSGVMRTHLPCFGMFYSRKHRVILTISSESNIRRVRVWATTPRPVTLVQTVTPAPTAGRVSRLSVRLLGSDSEPCPGESVRWTAPSGYQVITVQPVTDESGYALADLIVPMGAAGSASVTAEVVI